MIDLTGDTTHFDKAFGLGQANNHEYDASLFEFLRQQLQKVTFHGRGCDDGDDDYIVMSVAVFYCFSGCRIHRNITIWTKKWVFREKIPIFWSIRLLPAPLAEGLSGIRLKSGTFRFCGRLSGVPDFATDL